MNKKINYKHFQDEKLIESFKKLEASIKKKEIIYNILDFKHKISFFSDIIFERNGPEYRLIINLSKKTAKIILQDINIYDINVVDCNYEIEKFKIKLVYKLESNDNYNRIELVFEEAII